MIQAPGFTLKLERLANKKHSGLFINKEHTSLTLTFFAKFKKKSMSLTMLEGFVFGKPFSAFSNICE
jgi:hypothetical protein